MKTTPRPVFGALLRLVLLVTGLDATADTVRFNIERRLWQILWVSNAPATLSATFSTSAQGTGLQTGWIGSPRATNLLSGTNIAIATLENFIPGTNGSARDALDARFPLGSYLLYVESATTNPITGRVSFRTNTYDAPLTRDFPVVAPFATNIPPYSSLATTQTFSWPAWTTTPEAAAAFTLYEGLLDTNLLRQLATNAASVLTNLNVIAQIPSIPPDSTSLTINNIDPALDHLVLLELSDRSNVSTLPIGTTASTSLGIAFHPRTAPHIAAPRLEAALLEATPPRIALTVPATDIAPLPVGTPIRLQQADWAGPWSDVVSRSVPAGSPPEALVFELELPSSDGSRIYRVVIP